MKVIGLTGPSGAGKSTLCNLIPRFYNVTDGRILLDGNDIMDIKLHSLRRAIGMVSQSVFLFDGTIRDNIAYGTPDATDEEIIAAAKKANVHEFVESLDKGYDTEVGERGVKLSGGQRQRISIARVFLQNPKLLILDEATSALDEKTESRIIENLKSAEQKTCFIITHRKSMLKYCDIVIEIDESGNATLKKPEDVI